MLSFQNKSFSEIHEMTFLSSNKFVNEQTYFFIRIWMTKSSLLNNDKSTFKKHMYRYLLLTRKKEKLMKKDWSLELSKNLTFN